MGIEEQYGQSLDRIAACRTRSEAMTVYIDESIKWLRCGYKYWAGFVRRVAECRGHFEELGIAGGMK